MDFGKSSVSSIYSFMKDIDFPATKQDIIDHAEESNVSQDIIDRLEQLPDKQYNSIADVVKEAVM